MPVSVLTITIFCGVEDVGSSSLVSNADIDNDTRSISETAKAELTRFFIMIFFSVTDTKLDANILTSQYSDKNPHIISKHNTLMHKHLGG